MRFTLMATSLWIAAVAMAGCGQNDTQRNTTQRDTQISDTVTTAAEPTDSVLDADTDTVTGSDTVLVADTGTDGDTDTVSDTGPVVDSDTGSAVDSDTGTLTDGDTETTTHSTTYAPADLSVVAQVASAVPVRPGLYGVNQEHVHQKFEPDNGVYVGFLESLATPVVRYPAGTASNYLDLLQGFAQAWDGADQNNLDRVDDINNAILANHGAGGMQLASYAAFSANHPSVMVVNVTSVSVQNNRQVLESLAENGAVIDRFELGNEVFYGNYATAVASVDEYISRVLPTVADIRELFPGAAVSVVVPAEPYTDEIFLDTPVTGTGRLQTWYAELAKQSFFDAISVHLYSKLGMDGTTPVDQMLPFVEAYKVAQSHADARLDNAIAVLERDFPNKEIWVTEYHVGGFSGNLRSYRLRYTYLGGLYAATFLLKLSTHAAVTLANWHSLNQMMDIALSGGQVADITTKLNGYFLSMFAPALRACDMVAPLRISGAGAYTVDGEFAGTYPDTEGALYWNTADGNGFLILINKMNQSHTVNLRALEDQNGLVVEGITRLSPTPTMPVEDAVEDESVVTPVEDPLSEILEVGPYTLIRLSIRRQ